MVHGSCFVRRGLRLDIKTPFRYLAKPGLLLSWLRLEKLDCRGLMNWIQMTVAEVEMGLPDSVFLRGRLQDDFALKLIYSVGYQLRMPSSRSLD